MIGRVLFDFLIDDPSRSLEYETTLALNNHSKANTNQEIQLEYLTNDDHSLLLLQQEKTEFNYDSSLTSIVTRVSEAHLNNDQLKAISSKNDPFVMISLDLHDDVVEKKNSDDENSLTELFFKRIVIPEGNCCFPV